MKKTIVVVGLGRVGLPLALTIDQQIAYPPYSDYQVVGIDKNEKLITSLQNGEMPFHEQNCQELLSNNTIQFYQTDNCPELENVHSYIITVGTPLKNHIETDLTQIMAAIDYLLLHFPIRNSLFILRSTVAPNTTKYIAEYIESKTQSKTPGHISGVDFFVAHCPERIAEGVAHEELLSLPQIVGTQDQISIDKCKEVFNDILGLEVLSVSYIEAELAKLMTNIYRYINFAIPNYFMYLARQYKVDIYSLLRTMKYKYPRNNGLKTPGPAAGTCVPGNRQISIFNNIEKTYEAVVSYEDLYDEWVDGYDSDRYVDSFSSHIGDQKFHLKKIMNVTKRKYTGTMYKFHFVKDDDTIIFECTADHLIPTPGHGLTRIITAKEFTEDDFFYSFINGRLMYSKVTKIETYGVIDFDVYNIELESQEKGDDLFYCDHQTNIVHHNCLRKDFGLISETTPHTDLLLQAYKINENMPYFYSCLVGLKDKVVGVLGYTFKKDVDDERDSLTPKLIRYIQRKLPKEILINEPNFTIGTHTDQFEKYHFENKTILDVIENSEIIFIAVNHSDYEFLKNEYSTTFKNKIVVDCWNILDKNLVNIF